MHTRHINSYLLHPFIHLVLPIFKILFPIFASNEIFYFHGFQLSQAKKEVAWSYFVSESFTNLSYTKGELRMKSIHCIFKIHKYPLRGFRSQINSRSTVLHCAYFRREHHVELSSFSKFPSTVRAFFNIFNLVCTKSVMAFLALN